MQKNKTSEAEVQTILTHYNPDYIVKNCRGLTQAEITNLCLFSPSPTLSDLNATYGKNVPIAWIMAQLFSLSEFCGAKEKMSEDKAEQTAFIIASSHYYLKVTELILFFHQMKAGHYGQFYGVIDPNVSVSNSQPVTKMYKDNGTITNVPYNNIYVTINGENKLEAHFYMGEGFNVNSEYNNGNPYIEYDGTNLVSIIPTLIQVNKAFDTYYTDNTKYVEDDNGNYVWDSAESKYVLYNEAIHLGEQRYILVVNAMYKQNIALTTKIYLCSPK